MAKLWQKDYTVDSLLEEFTVGLDWQFDLALVRADCLGSVAQARGLAKLGILSGEELARLEAGLRAIAADSAAGKFAIKREDEDCHTAIENRLVAELGEAGKKIHTGRSRNDQVVTACRLYGKSTLLEIREALLALVARVRAFAEAHRELPMPGRTHMQIAMPSSVGLWAGALAEQLADDYRLVATAFELCDRSPLGSSAGYGVPLELDRDYTARLMGFAGPANNVLYASNSRGKVEAVVLDALDHVGLTLSKYAQDLILFSLPEFGYFKLPDRLCTGSSIMPQKKNPDGLELLRSRSALLSGWAAQCKMVLRSLPTGYNRDFQDTKEPWLRGLSVALAALRIMELTFAELKPNPDRLKAAFTPEIYATDDALRLVAGGMSFRDAYRQVGLNLDRVQAGDPVAALCSRRYPGTTGNLNLEALDAWTAQALGGLAADRAVFAAAIRELLGEDGYRL
jgi:argininosuccinate lyase